MAILWWFSINVLGRPWLIGVSRFMNGLCHLWLHNYTLHHAVASKHLHVESVLLWTPNYLIVIVTKLPVNLLNYSLAS